MGNDLSFELMSDKAPFIIKEDEEALKKMNILYTEKLNKKSCLFESFDDYQQNENLVCDNSIHFGLLPAPICGNLEKAKIFILTLNPGFTPCEYKFEYEDKNYKDAAIRALAQTNFDDEYPFHLMNPKFEEHPGYTYWTERKASVKLGKGRKAGNKFKDIAEYLTVKNYKDLNSKEQAFKFLSHYVTTIEYFPYHSQSYAHDDLADSLKSTRKIKEYVYNVVLPLCRKGEALIVIPRKASKWGIKEEEKNVVQYLTAGKATGASLTTKSDGGKAIIKFIEDNRKLFSFN